MTILTWTGKAVAFLVHSLISFTGPSLELGRGPCATSPHWLEAPATTYGAMIVHIPLVPPAIDLSRIWLYYQLIYLFDGSYRQQEKFHFLRGKNEGELWNLQSQAQKLLVLGMQETKPKEAFCTFTLRKLSTIVSSQYSYNAHKQQDILQKLNSSN